ncbi:MAG: hypothetical protein HY040_07940 [Planctomycetes bacterium]|nr:hypothetical protein [Planctomycetota bacterium]
MANVNWETPMILADWMDELGGRGLSVVLGLVLGAAIAWLIGRWRRMREKWSILQGDARDTVVIHQHIIEPGTLTHDGASPPTLRIRVLGLGELKSVIPNGHLASIFLHRAFAVTPTDTLISMDGAEGSYLLETLTGFVCDRVANAPFEHDLYVMAPCCEPAELSHHQPIAVLLISVKDLVRFESWPACRAIQVEHGSDGARILTLMLMAQRFKAEQDKLAEMRKAGQRTRFIETMYVLDLPLDKRAAAVPTKEVAWGRFEGVLKQLNLE